MPAASSSWLGICEHSRYKFPSFSSLIQRSPQSVYDMDMYARKCPRRQLDMVDVPARELPGRLTRSGLIVGPCRCPASERTRRSSCSDRSWACSYLACLARKCLLNEPESTRLQQSRKRRASQRGKPSCGLGWKRGTSACSNSRSSGSSDQSHGDARCIVNGRHRTPTCAVSWHSRDPCQAVASFLQQNLQSAEAPPAPPALPPAFPDSAPRCASAPTHLQSL